LEVINAARIVTGLPIETRVEARRSGDPSRLVADCSKASKVLGWVPAYTDLASVIGSAWEWSRGHPTGYEE
ncbi:MAG TPA: UDP-glucose 4-epimerase, partial [Blastocatellia bacterium]|nr:UDP-glucose 4-epimerase [Blastocatellia bacterium]